MHKTSETKRIQHMETVENTGNNTSRVLMKNINLGEQVTISHFFLILCYKIRTKKWILYLSLILIFFKTRGTIHNMIKSIHCSSSCMFGFIIKTTDLTTFL